MGELDIEGNMADSAARMKGRHFHKYHLARVAVKFRSIKQYSGQGEFVFPSVASRSQDSQDRHMAFTQNGLSGKNLVSHGS